METARHSGACRATCSPGISWGRAEPSWEQAATGHEVPKKPHEFRAPWSSQCPQAAGSIEPQPPLLAPVPALSLPNQAGRHSSPPIRPDLGNGCWFCVQPRTLRDSHSKEIMGQQTTALTAPTSHSAIPTLPLPHHNEVQQAETLTSDKSAPGTQYVRRAALVEVGIDHPRTRQVLPTLVSTFPSPPPHAISMRQCSCVVRSVDAEPGWLQ